ncbi:RNA 2',3'-cyclic phosphodiesterase [Sphingomonas sp. RB56-2]|uniref:RNA 2',3'-cyclic phosphodiesterase n=1 Tax=Sphingomonas brevis TaxID=2908206 RepID=A0ABT0S874_9SPHN|nr:RNA 2',3'-cyclic phosphodiesterase [Sphingomonas brevis]MCL6740606.1 RNA 2',3'-cyclic phosphodiesterase [Sphingomonas brevis]
MHRLFVALRPPLEIRRHCLAAMAGGPPGWAWQDDAQLHVTLRFIGEVERPVAEDIASALNSVRAPAAKIGLHGVGFFDQGRQGVLFARTIPRDLLEALHKKVDRALTGVGLPPERRAFLPHITLARRRKTGADPAGWLKAHSALSAPAEPVGEFILYESHLGRDGPHYEPIAAYPLAGLR